MLPVTSCTSNVVTISSPGKASYTCGCCDDACLTESRAKAAFCRATTPTPGPGPTDPTSPPASVGPVRAAPSVSEANLVGPETGKPFQSRNEFFDNEGRRLTTGIRAQVTRTQTSAADARASAQSKRRATARDSIHQSRSSTPGCFSVAQSAKFSFFSALPAFTASATESSTFPPLDPLEPFIALEEGKAVSLEGPGSGVRQGPRDTPPPPNPKPVNKPTECDKGWHYNPTNGTCYFSQKSCDSQGAGCYPPNRDPSLGETGHVNHPNECPKGTSYNPGNRSCYRDQRACAAQLQPQAEEPCTVPNP